MIELREKVARVLVPKQALEAWRQWLPDADAAIAAVREHDAAQVGPSEPAPPDDSEARWVIGQAVRLLASGQWTSSLSVAVDAVRDELLRIRTDLGA